MFNLIQNHVYAVYNIVYSGNKLPPKYDNISPSNYIGSTSISKIENGYLGSVSSKLYRSIWKKETKENPSLFNLEIISTHETREEALEKELHLQQIFNVPKNPLFVNKSYATINGFFGCATGVPHSVDHKEKISKSLKGKIPANRCGDHDKIKLSQYTRSKISKSLSNRKLSDTHKHNISLSSKGISKPISENKKIKLSTNIKTSNKTHFFSIIATQKSYSKANLSRYHPEFKLFY